MDGHAGDAEHERASRRTGALGVASRIRCGFAGMTGACRQKGTNARKRSARIAGRTHGKLHLPL